MTVFPNIFEVFLRGDSKWIEETAIDADVPQSTMKKLEGLPYFDDAFAEDGMDPERFATHPALELTASSFAQAMSDIETFAAEAVGLG